MTGKTYVMSFDGPAGSQNYVNIDLKAAAKQVDFITIDGYNYAGSWDTQTNDASPLFDSKKDPLYGQGLDIDATVNAYLKAGVPASKYTMGVAALRGGLDRGSECKQRPVPEFDGSFAGSAGQWNWLFALT